MSNSLTEKDWRILLQRISEGRCTPFLGAGACYGTLPLGSDIAAEWAQTYLYPLDDRTNLTRVAQFLAVDNQDGMFPKDALLRRINSASCPNFADPLEPHRLLADLPLPVYMTTNYDDFMVKALRSRHKDPRRELCRWNQYLRDHVPSAFDRAVGYEPTVANPVVFHLHGHNEVPESLVLTEDDYFDFLVNVARDDDLLPPRIQKALSGSSLLFVGYSLADWDFRVIFRSLVGYLERTIIRSHVSVQIAPGAASGSKEKAQEYLTNYFGGLHVRVFWGTAAEFALELRRRWDTYAANPNATTLTAAAS